MIGYSANIEEVTEQNTNFRTVLYTGAHMQLVAMSLLPQEEIGLETHATVDQFFRVEVGQLKFILNGQESVVSENMVMIVPAGTEHNVINVGEKTAKLYTIYSPANHPEGTVHATKADAEAAEEMGH